MPGGKRTCSERSMDDILLPSGIKDLINVIYFLAYLSVIKDPIKIKIEVLLSRFNSLLVYAFKRLILLRCKIKFMSIFHIKKNSSAWGWS